MPRQRLRFHHSRDQFVRGQDDQTHEAVQGVLSRVDPRIHSQSRAPPPRPVPIQVWRGTTNTKLPEHFYTPDKFGGTKGGVEYGFTSTSTSRDQAVKYADGGASTVFYMMQGIVDRGADISWLSQFPEEEEFAGQDRTVPCPVPIASFQLSPGSGLTQKSLRCRVLFPPLIALEPIRCEVEQGIRLIIELRVSINLLAPTLEKFEEQRKDLVLNMCASLEDELTKEIEMDDKSWGVKKAQLADGVVSYEAVKPEAAQEQMALMRKRIEAQKPEYFQNDEQLRSAVAAALQTKSSLLQWPPSIQKVAKVLKAVPVCRAGLEPCKSRSPPIRYSRRGPVSTLRDSRPR